MRAPSPGFLKCAKASGSAAMTGGKNGLTAEIIYDQRGNFPEIFRNIFGF